MYDRKQKYHMIDLDIDVADNEPAEIINNGYVSLPLISHGMKLNREMIDDIHTIAESLGIPVSIYDRNVLVESGKYMETCISFALLAQTCPKPNLHFFFVPGHI